MQSLSTMSLVILILLGFVASFCMGDGYYGRSSYGGYPRKYGGYGGGYSGSHERGYGGYRRYRRNAEEADILDSKLRKGYRGSSGSSRYYSGSRYGYSQSGYG